VFPAQVLGPNVFYTKTLDPLGTIAVPVWSLEQLNAGQDPALPGACTPWDGSRYSVGPVTMTVDQALASLVTPFHVK
jgi:hypothetical protein